MSEPPAGIVLLDKPCGVSSNGALQRVRRLLGGVKGGHVGSLDPLASGMLPICLGEATKIAGDILDGAKRYRFTIALGARTATGDAEGAVVETGVVPELKSQAVETLLKGFLGVTSQVPPMYSAIKRGGEPLYKLARAGVSVERSPRPIELFELSLLRLEGTALMLETRCSKGTYVRTLAEDVARALGTVGHVSYLRRLWVEPFEAEPMQTFESIESARASGGWPHILAPDYALRHLLAVHLGAVEAQRLRHGQPVLVPGAAAAPRVRLYDASGLFLGLGECDVRGNVQPRRMFIVS
jgi:tRNA pseudouridine55 synthase